MNSDRTIQEIWSYMREGRKWRDETSVSLALLARNQADCADHEKRITATEGFQARVVKMAIGFSTAMGAISGLAVEWFKH